MLVGALLSTLMGMVVIYLIGIVLGSYVIPEWLFWLIVIGYLLLSLLWSPALAGVLTRVRYGDAIGLMEFAVGWLVGVPMSIVAWVGVALLVFTAVSIV
jgi:ABC-type transport system involved in multi-copper enzyme maturation permease subunit